jgi:hypothetical protein
MHQTCHCRRLISQNRTASDIYLNTNRLSILIQDRPHADDPADGFGSKRMRKILPTAPVAFARFSRRPGEH